MYIKFYHSEFPGISFLVRSQQRPTGKLVFFIKRTGTIEGTQG